MARIIKCLKLNREAEALEEPPFPGDLGKKIFENISKEAWENWISLQTRLINEYRLNLLEPEAKALVIKEMKQYLFEKEDLTNNSKS